MKKILILFSLLILSCTQTSKKEDSLLNYIPKEAAIVIRINNFEKASSDLQNNDFIKKNGHLQLVKYFEELPTIALENTDQESLLCLIPQGKEDFAYTLVTKYNSRQLESDSLSTQTITKETYNQQPYYNIQQGATSFYATKVDSVLIATSSKLLIENTLRLQNTPTIVNKNLIKAYNATNNDQAFSILLNSQELQKLSHHLTPNSNTDKLLTNFGDWGGADITADQNELYIDGVVTLKDSIPSVLGIFRNTLPQENKITKICPASVESIQSYTYDDFEVLKQNLALFQDRNSKDMPASVDALLLASSEISVIQLTKSKILMLTLIDKEMSTENLINQKQLVTTYRGVPIYKYEDPTIFSTILTPLVPPFEANYFFELGGFIGFSKNQEGLHTLIANYKNGSILSKTPAFQKLSEHLSDQASMLFIKTTNSLQRQIKEGVSASYQNEWEKLNTKKHPLTALQFINENNFAHLHAVLQKNTEKASTKTVSQIASTTLDHTILSNPHLVKNHRTKGMDIVVQDSSHQLYLISAKGNVFWKKQLDGPVLGEIQQLDIFKNGRLQLIFNTDKSIYLIDRNGNNVSPYPKKFNNPITQPLAVFDYDNNKRYRIMATQGSRINMFDALNKKISGFNFKGTKTTLTQTPKHIRLGSKDYILFTEKSGKLTILDRVGRPRVKTSESISFSDNEWYGYKGNFTSLSSNGELVTVTPSGKTTKVPGFDKNAGIATTSKTLVTLSENKLTIKGNEITLDFGLYEKPKIFYIKNKIYVSTTDIEAKKVYLYDSNGILLPGFPVYGSSSMSLGNMDKDSALEFTVKGENNGILIYEIN